MVWLRGELYPHLFTTLGELACGMAIGCSLGILAGLVLGRMPIVSLVLRPIIVGLYNVFEAARRNKVKRILFATSNHAVGFYRRDEKIDHRVYPKPDSRYGVSKVFGEALGSLYADKYGMEVYNMRIGNVNPEPVDKRRLSIWISPRDLAQLVTIGIEHPDIRFEIVYGISANKRAWYDNSNAERLGYKPQDDSEKWAKGVAEKVDDPVSGSVAWARKVAVWFSKMVTVLIGLNTGG